MPRRRPRPGSRSLRHGLSLRHGQLPAGVLSVGAGLLVAGLTTYGFLAISARAMGPARFAPLSALWALVLIGGPGLFFPLEQEVARAVSARQARGEGGGPVVRRAAVLGAAVSALVVVALVLARAPVGDLFDHQQLLVVGLVLAVPGFAGQHLARGALAGTGRFGRYGLLLALEGLLRLVGSVALALAGVSSAGPYGLVVGAAPLLGLLAVRKLPTEALEPGPQPPWAELSQALGHLLAASVLSQVLVNLGPVMVKVLAPPEEEVAAGRFLASLVLARVPLFLFAAVQAALLPRLSRLAAAGRVRELTTSLVRLLATVAVVCGVAVVAAPTAGPAAVRVLFGSAFSLARGDLALLAAASSTYIVALVCSQGLIAVAAHRETTLGWLAGVLAFAATIGLAGGGAVTRVEWGLLIGAVVAAAVHAGLLVRRVRALPAGPDRPGAVGPAPAVSPGQLDP